MIEKLYIRNYLIIKEAEINFSRGLNIFTGETGAGKTIILDALSLILGERADYSIVKHSEEKLIVEGYFNLTKNENVNKFLKSNELLNENNHITIVRRELFKKGFSRNFINDNPVNTVILKEFGELIIDIHSQNEHQSLLKKENHTDILDELIEDKMKFNEFKELYNKYKELIIVYEEMIKNRDRLTERKDYLEFQLKEINNLNPKPNEDKNIEEILQKLENVETISITLENSINILTGSETNILSGISNVIKEIKKISKYDKIFENDINELEKIIISLIETERNLSNYINSLSFDPAYIDSLRERTGQLQFLKKKYRMSLNELIDKAEDIKNELSSTENLDFEIEKTEKIIKEEKEKLYNSAKQLSEQRFKGAQEIQKNIKRQFKEVGLDNADFKVNITKNKGCVNKFFNYENKGEITGININGIDDIEFLVITNKGEEFQPLKKVASGGEISRIMLSIKSSLSDRDKIPILIFDEIDAGISGRIAEKVGKVLKNLSKTHQLISITHLPQIAAFSDNHFSVTKTVINKETVARIKKINKEEKVDEIAKLLSGEKVTDIFRKTARELIENTKQ
ncbi:MAG: DNA repair protein RecN [Ignavibacteria bacterium]|nr:DNA repair protein RecN [Ignavibacteria bacterium]